MRFIIVGYRDAYFWNEFGTSVRDLQIAEVLSRKSEVIFINRPVSIYERLLNKKKVKSVYKHYSKKVTFIDTTSLDFIGPLKGRVWTEKCYCKLFTNVLEKYTNNYEDKVVVIDFTPLAKIQYIKRQNVYYWYDLIDNFAIHNRFSETEKKMVKEKYAYVDEHADLITGVSDKSIMGFTNPNTHVMPNGVYLESKTSVDSSPIKFEGVYDLGFVGFITDKFDVDFINNLSENFSIVIWGRFFDEKVRAKLNKNIKIAGSFKYSDLPRIMKTFKVGLLPYLESKSHDESPLKMYEYFKHSLPCISSMKFEIESKWFWKYSNVDSPELDNKIKDFIKESGSDEIRESIKSEWYFENKIKTIVSKFE
ncbi:TPA: glycosyl transferase [Enterobacter kobei]|uniref:glycosyl transferase n=1 Tax=Enterobacter kobei TaxID=208224 RepID=UPI0022ACCCCD|nr:glycosyl transferase [Enterobacter kobei]MDN2617098.1 glycosyl transferase [Enterobacter kobei]HCT5581013.1 glycosyl transferase [Enterobacter kobei]